ncbi:hypothetical protein [Alsobacter soli]|uniref:hypothetical protein n=1 Tax=Alsobacter soli TaxID=2109933 RepID=UPI001304D20B|nr:hypothetical protein [Alsobacter soli]
MTIGMKIVSILCIVAIPFAMMTGLFINQVLKDIHTANEEAAGLRQLQPVWQAYVGAGSADRAAGAGLSDIPAASGFSAAIAVGKPRAEVLEAGRLAIQKIADTYGLTLDPDLDSYYVGDMVVSRLPLIVSAGADLLRAGGELAKGGPVSGGHASDLRFDLAMMRDSVDGLASDYTTAVGGNKDGSVASGIGPNVERVKVKFKAVAGAAEPVLKALEAGQPVTAAALEPLLDGRCPQLWSTSCSRRAFRASKPTRPGS